ncbi:hypothetical protein jhhlp_006778 [Lomentospora prolificans]|uniref:BTB domain-containing protein n=1 Tax=Lomentospora prolificans TaxID=41688 RepID=A0A2N3N2R4_9PEZI|nr:hypothetical protein jhhlp_006778 [Lomentospora prolificans]
MFGRSFRSNQDQIRVDKSARLKKSHTVRDPQKLSKLQRSFGRGDELPRGSSSGHGSSSHRPHGVSSSATVGHPSKSLAPSPIVTLTVGREGRLFAAHENVLCQSPFFDAACRGQLHDVQGKRISLPDEEPEVFSAVLEYLYKGDYYPRLIHNKHRNSWELEDSADQRSPYPSPAPDLVANSPHSGRGGRPGSVRRASFSTAATTATTSSSAAGPRAVEPTVYLSSCGDELLRDTVIYCAADRYGLDELKLLALRKQGLQSGIDVGTILRSAAYAYAHTPDSDSRLRAHYLALIIRCRRTFKRSGTMQAAMEQGGSKLFFDLFVAMCNHLDDVIEVNSSRTPRTV